MKYFLKWGGYQYEMKIDTLSNLWPLLSIIYYMRPNITKAIKILKPTMQQEKVRYHMGSLKWPLTSKAPRKHGNIQDCKILQKKRFLQAI